MAELNHHASHAPRNHFQIHNGQNIGQCCAQGRAERAHPWDQEVVQQGIGHCNEEEEDDKPAGMTPLIEHVGERQVARSNDNAYHQHNKVDPSGSVGIVL